MRAASELKRFSAIPRAANSYQNYVGLIDLIEECCGQSSANLFGARWMFGVEIYLKFVAISSLVMLLASNQAFVSVILHNITTILFLPVVEDDDA